MRHARRVMLLCALLGAAGFVSAAEVQGIRVATTETGTRVVLDLSSAVTASKAFKLENPARIVLDLPHSSLLAKLGMPEATGAVIAVRAGRLPHNGLRLVFEVNGSVNFQVAAIKPSSDAGHRLVLDLAGPGAPKAVSVAPSAPAVPVAIRPAHAPSDSGRDIIIAVDAGHGGVDPGASGRRGTREKDVVLEVAKALAARINEEPGMKAVLTRDGDYFISLQERTKRARRAKADLFVSVHGLRALGSRRDFRGRALAGRA
jgi:N-acetylmuramoyl-L-alanine amidase